MHDSEDIFVPFDNDLVYGLLQHVVGSFGMKVVSVSKNPDAIATVQECPSVLCTWTRKKLW